MKAGKVKYSFKYFPVVDQGRVGESTWAAQAAECANQQGKFWEYHDKLFQVWSGENVGTYIKPKLKQYAADLELDTATFAQCLDGDKTLSIVQADVAEGVRMGVRSTPSFFVNGGTLSLQSLDYSYFSRTFEAVLK